MKYSSKNIERAVEAFTALPGVGKRSALRYVLHLASLEKSRSERIVGKIQEMVENIQLCQTCFNYADGDECEICKSLSRKKSIICVVESVRDVLAIEETQQYRGLYHVLGGVISPLDGVGPEDIRIEELIHRVKKDDVEEILIAISPTIEGDTTMYYISNHLQKHNVKISTLARGVSFGGELEYVDKFTLGRSIQDRIPYELGEEV